MSSNIAISVSGLSKSYMMYDKPEHRLWQMLLPSKTPWYREFWALQNISFDVRRGETLAIIGRNGSGKSTLLQLICGTLSPTQGRVDVGEKIAALLELGAGFNTEFTGRENIYLNGAILGMSKTKMASKFDSIVEFADIGDFLDQPVKTYSSGMHVRLAFAVAIHCEPEVLVIDEALAVGDFLFQQKCNRFLKEEFSGVTKLLVTHDMAAVANLADRAIVLNRGELIYNGDPQSAIREYQIVARATNKQILTPRDEESDAADVPEDYTRHSDAPSGLTSIPEGSLSGTLQAKITKYAYQIDGTHHSEAIHNGQKLSIDFEISTEEVIHEAIVGYQVQDRFGNVIFGENSMTSEFTLEPIKPGLTRLTLHVVWPTLAPGKYALTLGIGSGYDPLVHTIQCWAHNIIVLDSSSDVVVHGLFNVKIAHLAVKECK